MIHVTPWEHLGGAEHGWLSTRHHFSFAEYMDPSRMGLGPLRVWNDDLIRPQSGFPMHPHRDMEILTYVRQGAITHEDSIGNRGRTEAGGIQVMSAGTGIVHSEYNLEDEETKIFQIWVIPNKTHLTPRWDAKAFPEAGKSAAFSVLASGDPKDIEAGSLVIHQDAQLMGARLNQGQDVSHVLRDVRAVYIVPSGGDLLINGEDAPDGAGIAIAEERDIEIKAKSGPVDVVMVEVPFPWQG